jgi:transposase
MIEAITVRWWRHRVFPGAYGKAVRTDRIDAMELAQFYANGLLAILTAPDAEIEQDRDLLRSRQRLLQQQRSLPAHPVIAAPQWISLQS